mgnify:CR=1 FL=1
MADTIQTMEYIYADILSADQLMENDCIEYLDEDGSPLIVEIQDLKTYQSQKPYL